MIRNGRGVDRLRSKDQQESNVSLDDFKPIAHVAQGQFGVVDLVTCSPDGQVYCMKTMGKATLRRARQHVSPVIERQIHTQALVDSSPYIPQLLCSFQSPSSLHLLIDYIPSLTLWDLLSTAPNSILLEEDVRFWSVGMVQALSWLHEHGWAHRDVKPHNFLVGVGGSGAGSGSGEGARIVLTDFGTAAKGFVNDADGKQKRKLRRKDCLWPVGTPDYIAPEVLEAHEDALVRAEEEEWDDLDQADEQDEKEEGYGLEVDWWSLGVMIYELVFGEAPFFAESIGDTYFRIINFETTLQFDSSIEVSIDLKDFIRNLLSHHSIRLGRNGPRDILCHPWFGSCSFDSTCPEPAPADLFLPSPSPLFPPNPSLSFADCDDANPAPDPFGFSDFFISSPGLSVLHSKNSPFPKSFVKDIVSPARSEALGAVPDGKEEWEGFAWGPMEDASTRPRMNVVHVEDLELPEFPHLDFGNDDNNSFTPLTNRRLPSAHHPPPPSASRFRFTTPLRPSSTFDSRSAARSTSHSRHASAPMPPPSSRRRVTEAKALQQMVDCIGMSARKRVLESGRKPKLLVLRKFALDGSEIGRGRRDGEEEDDEEELGAKTPTPKLGFGSFGGSGNGSRASREGSRKLEFEGRAGEDSDEEEDGARTVRQESEHQPISSSHHKHRLRDGHASEDKEEEEEIEMEPTGSVTIAEMEERLQDLMGRLDGIEHTLEDVKMKLGS